MADTFTTHYNLTKPQVGGDPDTWGGLLNTNFDTIDSQLYIASTYALPLAGGANYTGANLTLLPATGAANLVLDRPTAAASVIIWGRTNGSNRWSIVPGSGGTESGGNVSSDFRIDRYSDAGTQIDSPLTVTRSSGLVNIGSSGLTSAGPLTGSSVTSTGGTFNSSASTAVLQPTGAGTVYLRPNNGSTTGQATVGSDGRLTINGPTTANGAVGIVTSGSTGSLAITDTGGNGANLALNGNGGATPNKAIRAAGGNLEFINSAYSAVVAHMDDSGHWFGADFSASSDARLKTRVRKLRRGLDELKRMLPREYIKDGREELGFIAQEAQQVIPEAVTEGDDGLLRLSYGQVTALLAAAILDIDRRLQTEGI